jgi:hypothetical protein
MLSPERIKLLEGLDIIWDPIDAAWSSKLTELAAYKAKYGDCNVPEDWRENPQLAKWVSNQRNRYKSRVLLPDRIKLLEDLGFIWSPRECLWNNNFAELTAYKAKYGDCNVPQGCPENPQLGSWVSGQRRAFKKGKLSADRIKLLDDLGFCW